MLGPQWRPAGHAIAGLCGMVLGTAVVSISSELLKAVGRPAVLIAMEIVGFCLILVTVTVSAVLWGPVGVAIAMSLSTCGTGVYGLARLCSVLELALWDMLLEFLGPLVASVAMIAGMLGYAALANPLEHAAALRIALLILDVLVGAIVYGAVLAVIDPPRRREAMRLVRARLGRRATGAA
jgi:O-antigen/teichoic acid export membrane protein